MHACSFKTHQNKPHLHKSWRQHRNLMLKDSLHVVIRKCRDACNQLRNSWKQLGSRMMKNSLAICPSRTQKHLRPASELLNTTQKTHASSLVNILSLQDHRNTNVQPRNSTKRPRNLSAKISPTFCPTRSTEPQSSS